MRAAPIQRFCSLRLRERKLFVILSGSRGRKNGKLSSNPHIRFAEEKERRGSHDQAESRASKKGGGQIS